MPKVWNIGNTTVRNPKRIETALKVFIEEGFSGNAKGKEIEERLQFKLREKGILEFDGEPSEWNGRKWRAAFYQLGFISFERYHIGNDKKTVAELFKEIKQPNVTLPYQLTQAGNKLVSAKRIPEIEEIYTRQFACYELPNSLESEFLGGCLKPFILFLEVLMNLQAKNASGLSKFETGLFLQQFYDHTSNLAEEISVRILNYRQELTLCQNNIAKKVLKEKYLDSLKAEIGINPLSAVQDYSDTTFRYFYLTGLFSRKGETICIRDSKIEYVNKLLESEPIFMYRTNPIEYFKKFYSCTYKLPIDDITFSFNEIQNLKNGITNKQNPLFKRADSLSLGEGLTAINKLRHDLIEYNNWERETDFAIEQQTASSVEEILQYLKGLNGEKSHGAFKIDDKPAYFEWAVWRCFLAINEIVSPIHKTRRFPVDQDFHPRNTAPGGGSDLIFEFKKYVLVVEVTLTSSYRQMAVESEPVRRHTVKYQESFEDKDVYCLFLAPTIDNNVVETFRIGVWYKNDKEEFVNIVPMTLGDFISIFEVFLKKKFTNLELKNLLDRCLVFRNVRAPQWKLKISSEVAEWKRSLLNY